MAEEVKPAEEKPNTVIVDGEERQKVMMQRVFIKFSSGKVGMFQGLALFSSTEMKLMKLDIADIAFSEPYEMLVRVPKQPEAPNAATESPKQ